jgi:hypothetical protein
VPAYGVGLRASAEKQLAALDKPVGERVAAAIDALAETSRPSGAIAIQGAAGLLRNPGGKLPRRLRRFGP